MAKDVKCGVITCRYHSKGDMCSAPSIEVTVDANSSSNSCNCSSETNCKTFVCR